LAPGGVYLERSDWGCGSTGTEKNRFGALLMELRSELRTRAAAF
jgi:predicted NAD-dependent protein-ADP-ribosyltransferase YbiA (DUF1768 family)